MSRFLSDASSTRFHIDEICSRFECQWEAKSLPAHGIEELLSQVSADRKPELLEELVAVDLELRIELGQAPKEEDYTRLFPQFKESIERAFLWVQSDDFRPKPQSRIPKQIGDFRITREIGRGGMGIVYEAIQESLGRRVAIKTFAPRIATPELKTRFQREVKTIGALRHTNIVEVYGTGEDDGISYFAMQLIEGRSLKEQIESRRVDSDSSSSMPIDDQRKVALVGKQVASGLAYAHESGVLHRDVKPSNILLDDLGAAHISDFGLAKFTQDEDDLTQTGEVIGSLRYLAPEVVTQNQYDKRSDIFSLGLTLYELLILEPAYDGKGASQLLYQTSNAQIAQPRKSNPSVNRDLESIIMKCLAPDAADRYQTANEVHDDLERFLGGHPVEATRTTSLRRAIKWAKRNPILSLLFAVLFLVATVGFPALFVLNRSANAARELADVKRVAAELAEADALLREYSSAIQLASKFVDEGHRNEAEPLLNQCRPEYGETDMRDWEWYFVKSQTDSAKFTLSGHTGWVHHVAIRPDSKQIATVGGARHNSNLLSGEVILWDADSGKEQLRIPGDANGTIGAAYHPGGKELATISFSEANDRKQKTTERDSWSSIKIWNPETAECLRSFQFPGAQPKSALVGEFIYPLLPGIQYSPDGEKILAWAEPIQLLDAESGAVIWQLDEGHQATFVGDELVAVLALDSVNYVNAKTGKVLASFPAEKMQFLESFGESGLSAISQNRFIHWNVDNPLKFKPSIESAQSICWAASTATSSQFIFGDGEGAVRIQSQNSDARFETRLGHQGQITTGAVSTDETFFVTGSRDHTVRVWETRWDSIKKFDTGLRTRLGDFAFANNGEIVFAGNSKASVLSRDFPQAGIFKLVQSEPITTTPNTTFAIHAARNDIRFSSDGRFLAAPTKELNEEDSYLGFSTSRTVGVWDAKTGKLLATIDVDLDQITCLQWSDDSKGLAVAGTKNDRPLLCIFNADSIESDPQELAFQCSDSFGLMKKLGSERPSVVSFSKDGRQVACASGKQVLVLDLETHEIKNLYRSTNDQCRIAFLDFSPDSNRLAVAFHNERVVREFNLQTGELTYETTAPRSVSCVRYSPNGKRIAMNGYDSRIYLCDASNGYRLLTLDGCDQVNGGHQFTPRVLFSRDGNRIAANNFVGEVMVWSIE